MVFSVDFFGIFLVRFFCFQNLQVDGYLMAIIIKIWCKTVQPRETENAEKCRRGAGSWHFLKCADYLRKSAHNPEVVGSNPISATMPKSLDFTGVSALFLFSLQDQKDGKNGD